MLKKTLTFFCLVALSVMVWTAGPAHAHSLHVFAYMDGGQLKGEGAYSDGSAAAQARIMVRDADGKDAGSSKTDSEGAFALKLGPGRAPFLVEIDDGAGHRGTFEFTPEAAAAAPQPAAQASAANTDAAPAAAPATSTLTRDEVADLLRRELAPIKRQLARLDAGPSFGFREIVGGLGWIVGLAGLALWWSRRKKPPTPPSA